MCFVWIWEQTAIISLYNINWVVFITETESVYCAVRTGSLYTASLTFSNSTFCPHHVFMCFVWIWEQTAIISQYSINWLVFITETGCVYCAVRTGSLYTASLTFSNSTFCPHSVFMCFVWIWEQTAIIWYISRAIHIHKRSEPNCCTILILICGFICNMFRPDIVAMSRSHMQRCFNFVTTTWGNSTSLNVTPWRRPLHLAETCCTPKCK